MRGEVLGNTNRGTSFKTWGGSGVGHSTTSSFGSSANTGSSNFSGLELPSILSGFGPDEAGSEVIIGYGS
jgi:hypothetical protein